MNIDSRLAEALRRIPVLRYLKDPVLTIGDLQMKYPQGGEGGWFAFVLSLKTFVWWDVDRRAWRMIELSSDHLAFATAYSKVETLYGMEPKGNLLLETEEGQELLFSKIEEMQPGDFSYLRVRNTSEAQIVIVIPEQPPLEVDCRENITLQPGEVTEFTVWCYGKEHIRLANVEKQGQAYTDGAVANEATFRMEADATEAAARSTADTTLQGNINAEASARSTADTMLQTAITNEATARFTADATEAQSRSSADTTLQSNINAEVQARDEAIAVEAQTRLTADATLQGNINAEAAARAGADTTLQTAITNEATARSTADATEAQSRSSADTTLQSNINAEAQARTHADDTLQGNINAEAAARAEADTTLQNNIDAEAQARLAANGTLQAGIGTLQSNINAEATARANADTALQGNINTEAQARTHADDTEAQARAEADTTLQAGIDAEAEARSTADDTLQENIDTEAQARAEADTTLQNNIDAEAQARDAAIAAAILTTQKWVASVQTIADLPDPSTFDHTENYLCRVIDDPDKTKDGVYQLIAGSAAWTYFSDNLDFIDETELEEAISAHNTATATHQDIRTAVSNEVTARTNADTTLQGAITAEASTRATADSALQDSIDSINDYVNFIKGAQTLTSVAGLPARGTVAANIGASQTLSIASPEKIKPGYVMSVRVRNTSGATIYVTLPSSAQYEVDKWVQAAVYPGMVTEITVRGIAQDKWAITYMVNKKSEAVMSPNSAAFDAAGNLL